MLIYVRSLYKAEKIVIYIVYIVYIEPQKNTNWSFKLIYSKTRGSPFMSKMYFCGKDFLDLSSFNPFLFCSMAYFTVSYM